MYRCISVLSFGVLMACTGFASAAQGFSASSQQPTIQVSVDNQSVGQPMIQYVNGDQGTGQSDGDQNSSGDQNTNGDQNGNGDSDQNQNNNGDQNTQPDQQSDQDNTSNSDQDNTSSPDQSSPDSSGEYD